MKGSKKLLNRSCSGYLFPLQGVTCCYENYIVGELMWGLKNVVHHFVPKEPCKDITKRYRLPLSKGLKVCIRKHKIKARLAMINTGFIACLGALHRVDEMLDRARINLRVTCDELVPEIGKIIEDHVQYAQVMMKILIPLWAQEEQPEFDFFKVFPHEIASKLKEADEASKHERQEMDDLTGKSIVEHVHDVRNLPVAKQQALDYLNNMVSSFLEKQKVEMAEKMSHKEPAGEVARSTKGPEALDYQQAEKMSHKEPAGEVAGSTKDPEALDYQQLPVAKQNLVEYFENMVSSVMDLHNMEPAGAVEESTKDQEPATKKARTL